MRGEFIDVGGARLYYYASGTRGTGEPLLLVHGFPTSSHLWARTVSLVSAGHRVIVPDLLGFGRSDPPSPNGESDLSVAGHAKRLTRLLDVLGAGRVAVVGHGIGAAIGVEMRRAQPHRVVRLGLVNPVNSLAGGPAESWALATLTPPARRLSRSLVLGLVRRRLASLYGDPSAHGPAIEHYLRPFREPSGGERLLDHVQALAVPPPTQGDHAPGGLASWSSTLASLPVAIVSGESDPLLAMGAAEQLAAEIPGSTLHRVAGGHMSPDESPEQVGGAVNVLLGGD